jgi:hypothetical protein
MANFFEVLRLIWEKKHDLARFLDKLPALLHDAGEGIETAGGTTRVFGQYMRGGQNAPINARQIMTQTADYFEGGRTVVRAAAQVIGQAADVLASIQVPVLEIENDTIDLGAMGKWSVVKSISVENKRLLQPASDLLDDGSTQLNSLGQNLKEIGEQLDALAAWFDSAGREMDKVGLKLIDGGKALQELG